MTTSHYSDSLGNEHPSHGNETVVAEAEVASNEPPATEKSIMPLPAVWMDDEVLYVLAKDGSIDPDDEDASLKAYAQKVIEKTGERRQVVVLPPWTPKTRLTEEEVDMILSFEPVCFEPYDEDTQRRLFPNEPVQETMEIMREAAETSLEAREDFIEHQDWIRGELERKGYVEVPNKFLQDKKDLMQWVQDEFEQMIKSINIPAKCFASYYRDKDDHKEEVALES